MGGDHGPEVVVKGVKLALDQYSAIEGLYLVGKEDEDDPPPGDSALGRETRQKDDVDRPRQREDELNDAEDDSCAVARPRFH